MEAGGLFLCGLKVVYHRGVFDFTWNTPCFRYLGQLFADEFKHAHVKRENNSSYFRPKRDQSGTVLCENAAQIKHLKTCSGLIETFWSRGLRGAPTCTKSRNVFSRWQQSTTVISAETVREFARSLLSATRSLWGLCGSVRASCHAVRSLLHPTPHSRAFWPLA